MLYFPYMTRTYDQDCHNRLEIALIAGAEEHRTHIFENTRLRRSVLAFRCRDQRRKLCMISNGLEMRRS
jgi:hypothetical protein